MKLKMKLTLIISALTTIVIAVLSVVLLSRMRSIQISLTMEEMKSSTGLYATQLENYYEDYMTTATIIAQIQNNFETIEKEKRRQRFSENLSAIFDQNPWFTGIYTVWKPGILDGMDDQYRNAPGCDATGNFVPFYTRDSGKKELKTAPDHQYLLLNLSNNQDISNPEETFLDGAMHFTVHFRAPIIDSQGEVVGLVGVVGDMNYSRDLVDSIVPFGEGRSELYTTDGTIIASHDKTVIGKRFQEAKIDRYGLGGVRSVERSLVNNEPALIRNKDLFVQTYPFRIGDENESWLLAASIPMEVVMRDINTMTKVSILVAFAAILISAASALAVAHQIAKPIAGVSETLKAISEGEGDLTKTIAVHSKSEVGDLAHYFNLTLKKIKELIVIIKQQTALLFDIGNELSVNMNETAAAVNQITANIQSIKSRVINQSASVTETNSTMEQITINIDKLNSHVERQSASVTKSSAAIKQMIVSIQSVTQTLVKNAGNVTSLAKASEHGRTSLQEVAGDIQGIARESEGLSEINSVMENIASQTNLLSMNAAIEAAHAGEAGKGFAVVAGEIRKLAESAAEQSKTTSEVLKKIKDSIDKITKSTSNVLNKFEAIDEGVRLVADQEADIRGAMEEQSAESQRIMEAMARLGEISQQVKDGSIEMLEGSKEVIQESKRLERVTQEIAGGMNEMALGADQINSAVTGVNTISGQNKENIEILVREISRFKVE
jgi:methyl-accepting chemotaxis protein